jgi:hypothetical protein
MLATRRETRTRSEFHSYLLLAFILTKHHDFVLGTVAAIRAVFVAFLILYSERRTHSRNFTQHNCVSFGVLYALAHFRSGKLENVWTDIYEI